MPPRPPAAVVPVPAASIPDPEGRRAIFGAPGRGWRHDFRVVRGPHVTDGRTVVDLTPEAEFYRSQIRSDPDSWRHLPLDVHRRLEPPPVASFPVPIEWVWIETIQQGPLTEAPPGEPLPTPPPRTIIDRLVDLDAPPGREPVPARDMPMLTGRRLVVSHPDGDMRDLRATSEPHERDERDGRGIYVLLTDESLWYRWTLTGERATPRAAAIRLAWVEG